jgi:hypothetical protein
MTRIPNTLFHFQTFVVFCMLTLVHLFFVTAWILICMQESRDDRRPGFNLKEL